HHRQAGAIRLRRRDGGGGRDAGHVLRAAAGDQRTARLATAALGVLMFDLSKKRVVTTEAPWVRYTLTGVALAFIALFLVLPLAAVFAEALRKGLDAFVQALREPDAW